MLYAIKNIVKKHLFFIIFIIVIGIYLGAKAIPENSWDGWRVGSAQTLLSDKHWVNDGFLKSYLLFLPQGYSKVVRYFDDPELRQHAHGTVAGGLIGQRLYYTHVPPGYLLPTALLMKLGVENRFWFRFLEIIFSLGSLVFLYSSLNIISNRQVAFLGTLFYGISVPFLNYADSLANQPIDALLSFAIIALGVWIAESESSLVKKKKKYLTFVIWILYFILASSSYDSTFFIFAFLIGLDLIIKRRIEWKKWIIWALAPILAFGLQILQNTLYLGWHDMLMDFYGIFNLKIVGSKQGFLISHVQKLIDPFDGFFGVKYGLGILIAVGGFLYVWAIKTTEDGRIIKYLALAGIAALFNFLLFPSPFFYQARIVAVFGGLLMAMIILETIKCLRQSENLNKKLKVLYFLILFFIAGLFILQVRRSYVYSQKSNNAYDIKELEYDKKIKNLAPGDKIVMQMIDLDREIPPSSPAPPYIRPETKMIFQLYGRHDKISGNDPYPQIRPEDEYYVGSPILGFVRTSDLIRDLSYLKKRSEFPFSAIILSDQKETIEKLRNDIVIGKISKTNLKIIELESGKFALIVPET